MDPLDIETWVYFTPHVVGEGTMYVINACLYVIAAGVIAQACLAGILALIVLRRRHRRAVQPKGVR